MILLALLLWLPGALQAHQEAQYHGQQADTYATTGVMFPEGRD